LVRFLILVKNIIPQLAEVIHDPQDKPRLMDVIDEIVSLTERCDDVDAINALCYIITVTEDKDVRSLALNIIGKINGR
jgi:hypothetical protein